MLVRKVNFAFEASCGGAIGVGENWRYMNYGYPTSMSNLLAEIAMRALLRVLGGGSILGLMMFCCDWLDCALT